MGKRLLITLLTEIRIHTIINDGCGNGLECVRVIRNVDMMNLRITLIVSLKCRFRKMLDQVKSEM